MANDTTYTVNLIAKNGQSVERTDNVGIDWLEITGLYVEPTDIRLGWEVASGRALSASGLYYTNGNVGSRLVVKGRIENARGTNGADNIQGNDLANILYGDAAATGAGGKDVLFGDEGDDTIYAGSGNDEANGAEGNDLIYGNSGADLLSGADGVDTLIGGTAADTLSGGADQGDTVSYAGSSAAVRIAITFGETTTGAGGDAQGDRINGFTDVIGSSHGDTITDTVKGTIAFDYNRNLFDGGIGNDTLALGGGNDIGIGGAGNDVLQGEVGDDRLDGGTAKDVLTGGIGKDRLTGGSGEDRFVYTSAADSTRDTAGRDTITDFSRSDKDKIDLRQIDADSRVKGNQSFDFIGTAAFSGAGGELRFAKDAGGMMVTADIDGDRKTDFAILVEDVKTLLATDFLL